MKQFTFNIITNPNGDDDDDSDDASDSTGKCISYTAAKDFDGKHTLKIKKKDVGEFIFKAIDGGWNIQDAKTEEYLGVNQKGELTRSESPKTVWTYKNHAFSTRYTKQLKLLKSSFKMTAYLSLDKNSSVTISHMYARAEVCNKTENDHHLNILYLNKKDGKHHTAVCARCGAKTEQEHSYGKLTKRCICGAKASKE